MYTQLVVTVVYVKYSNDNVPIKLKAQPDLCPLFVSCFLMPVHMNVSVYL